MSSLFKKVNLTPEQKKANLKSLLIFGAIALLLVIIDFASKWIVQCNVAEGQQIALIPNFLYITKSYNIAIAFSIGEQLGVWGRVINISISVIMSTIIIGYWILNNYKFKTFHRVMAALLSAGAVGNLIDRAFYWKGITGFDGVIDFIQFYLGGGPNAKITVVNPFATFNAADSYLTIGVIALIIYMIIDSIKSNKDDLTNDPREAKKEEENHE